MDMDQFRTSDRESAHPLERIGFRLLLASAGARQAASQTSHAVIRETGEQNDGAEPDQYRIQILSSRNEAFDKQQPKLARFSDLALPDHYSGAVADRSDPETTT